MRPFHALAIAAFCSFSGLQAAAVEQKIEGSSRVLSVSGASFRVPARPSFAGHIVPCSSQVWGLALDGERLTCGEPTAKKLGQIKKAMTLMGYAADGHPIYNNKGPKNPKDLFSETITVEPGYRKKAGSGPYEYVDTLGQLDECNGREGVTPEYPLGTYYYVLTASYPYVPRCWKGTPDESFEVKKPRAKLKAKQTAVIETSSGSGKKVDPNEVF